MNKLNLLRIDKYIECEYIYKKIDLHTAITYSQGLTLTFLLTGRASILQKLLTTQDIYWPQLTWYFCVVNLTIMLLK